VGDGIQSCETRLEELLHDAQAWVASAGALVFLNRGLRARHYILRHCREYLDRTCFSKKDKPLSADVATEAALHLNGYYLNLRGALDNLAWVLQIELRLLPGIDGTSSRGRTSIQLFGQKFINKLESAAPGLASRVSPMKEWGLDLAKLRDPAAHRIPLYVPSGFMTSQDQVDEFRRLDALSGAPKEELGGRRRIEIMLEAQQLASFEPLFCVTSSEGLNVYSIPRQLLYDHKNYLKLTANVLRWFRGNAQQLNPADPKNRAAD
jgi:hypothetical protein